MSLFGVGKTDFEWLEKRVKLLEEQVVPLKCECGGDGRWQDVHVWLGLFPTVIRRMLVCASCKAELVLPAPLKRVERRKGEPRTAAEAVAGKGGRR